MNDVMDANEAMAKVKGIVYAMRLGAISYDQAKLECMPYLAICNRKIEEIAKKYNKKARLISFTGLAR